MKAELLVQITEIMVNIATAIHMLWPFIPPTY